MIPAKIDPISITSMKEKGVETIVDWFDQHLQTFYTLGWSYLRNGKQIEELFYQSIMKVHKELPRFKNEVSFEMWVTSIFIHICRELLDNRSLEDSVESESEPRQDLFSALRQLKENEKEAVVLAYLKGFSKEEAAQLLHISVEKLKEYLFSGIQSLRKEMGNGSAFNGCKEYHKNYIDYLERAMERSEKVNFEVHIYHCQDCQEDLASFQDVILNLNERMEKFHMPSHFMDNVKARLTEKKYERQQKNKKRKRMGIIFASVMALLVGIEVFTGSFTNIYYTWTEENQQLRAFLQQGLGKRLNLETESDGVKIKIKSAIADDFQTLVLYEIEDTVGDNQYMIDFFEGVSVENEYEIMSREIYPRNYPPDLKSDENNKEKNVYQGKISLPPLKTDNGIIKLNIAKLQKLNRDTSDGNSFRAYDFMGYKGGEWNFEIPVTKKPSIEYTLNEEIEVEGIPVRFEKLTIAPTTTLLQFGINNEGQKKRIEMLNFGDLEANNKKVKVDMFGVSFFQQNMNWNNFQINFDPLFGEKPKEVNVQLESASLSVEDQNTIILDASQEYPLTFEYAGSILSIDGVDIGQPTNVVISNHEIENRAYENIAFEIVGEDEMGISSMEWDTEGVLVDKNGIEYDINQNPFIYEEIEQPRYFFTVQSIRLHSDNAEEKVIPKRLDIHGYNTTKYLDDIVKISLE